MASINYAAREISVKIVYYGPGLSGKTTNLQVIHRKVPPEYKSDMVSLATETDRTLFFDFLPLDLGKIKGFSTKFQLYTVPGQVYYNATRKLVLRGVDGVVFVADSGPDKVQENLESFQNLEENLAEYGYKRENIPIIIQYNKRDLPNAMSIEELQQLVNKYNLPWSEAVANKGKGVFDSLKLIGKIVIDYLNKKYSRGTSASPRAPEGLPAQPSYNPQPNQYAQPNQFQGNYNQYQMPPQQPLGGQFQQYQQPRQQFIPPQQQRPVVPPQQQPPRPMQQRMVPPQMTPGPKAAQSQFGMPPQATGSQQPFFQQRAPQQPFGNPPQFSQNQFTAPVQAPVQKTPSFQPNQFEEHSEEASFEQAPQTPNDFYQNNSFNAVSMEPLGTNQQHEDAEMFLEQQPAQQFAPPPQDFQQNQFAGAGKTDLDLEIEKYQREIEEKQKRGRAQQPAPQQPQQTQKPVQNFQQPRPQSPQFGANAAQNDYDVYNMEVPTFQPPIQPPPQRQDDDDAMFFTSVDPDKQKRIPNKKPVVNPSAFKEQQQQQKGFLSKFFNRETP
ncbi:MAG: hypothetical protein GX639_08310 [Fibrobacter sp.]|nr:hypothetical protein [Fibrobacter sp.]